MDLWRFETANRRRWTAFSALLAIALAAGCERDNTVKVDRNRPPETFITYGPEPVTNPQDPPDLFYRAHLYWRGEDTDGTIAGFRFAIDDTADPGAWKWTTKTDSVFRFPVAEIGSKEHLFLIRAVDNLGKQDASPDTARFESFTSANPVVRFVNDEICVTTQEGVTTCGLDKGDTVRVFSDIKFVWTGSDADGEVVGWESKFDQELAWRVHARGDTTRTVQGCNPGPHTMSVRAIDDAGAKSTSPDRFRVQCNFDPKTTIDATRFRGSLVRTWKNPVDTLVSVLSDGMGGGQDTMPLGCTVSMCWTSTDVDGPVTEYEWKIDVLDGRIPDSGMPQTCLDTAPNRLTTSSLDNSPGFVVSVKGIDVYGAIENRPDTTRIHVNFRPEVRILAVDGVQVDTTAVDTVTVTSGGNHNFLLWANDKDGDPALLKYRWLFSFDPPFTQPTELPNRTITQEFDPSTETQTTPRTLIVEAQDAGGASRPSFRDTLAIFVVPPSP